MADCPMCEEYEFQEPHEAWEGDQEGLCLLHSPDPGKDKDGGFTILVEEKIRKGDHNFAGVFFPDEVSFGNEFISANFENAQFEKNARFGEFSGDTNFSDVIFKKNVFFLSSKLSGSISFARATFLGEAIFKSVRFYKDADFSNATFSSKAYFSGGTIFVESADFSSVIFSREVNFATAEFRQEAIFSEVTFRDLANFSRAKFSYGDFSRASFSGIASFEPVKFFLGASFIEAKFQETAQAIFGGLLPSESHREDFDYDFRFLNIADGAKIIFRNSSLAQVLFTGTEVRKIEFDRVGWAKHYGRNIVYDELQVRKDYLEFSFGAVERLYRELKCNHEEKKDFKGVGDFHYGEMEMARLGKGWKRFFSLEQLYWLLSGYGERPGQAGLVLLGFFAMLLGLVHVTGLILKEGGAPVGWREVLLSVFEKGFLMRTEGAKPAGFWGIMVGVLSLILPAQAALFFLAVRNKLGRRR